MILCDWPPLSGLLDPRLDFFPRPPHLLESVALHPPVLVLLEAITVLQCSILLYIARDRGPGIDPITWWSIGMAVGSAGLVLLIVPGPRFINHELPVTLVILAAGFAWVAARNFAGQSAHWAIVAAGPVVWLLANRIPGIADAEGLGIGLSWGIGAFYQFAFVAALWPDGKEYLPARTPMLIFVGVHAAVYALRAALGATGLDAAYRAGLTNVLVLEGQFRVIGTAFLVLALIKQRAELTTARSLAAAQHASAARSRFVAQMSHELRTPLNGVFGLAQVLMRDPRLLSDQRAHVQALEIAGRHLLSIVNDALDLAKIDADRLEFIARQLDPVATAAECVALLRSAAVEKGITLRLELDRFMPKLILGDQTRLQQILLNLLSNAVKFTPDGGSVTLHVMGVPANLLAAGMPPPGVPLGGRVAAGGAAAGGSLGDGHPGDGHPGPATRAPATRAAGHRAASNRVAEHRVAEHRVASRRWGSGSTSSTPAPACQPNSAICCSRISPSSTQAAGKAAVWAWRSPRGWRSAWAAACATSGARMVRAAYFGWHCLGRKLPPNQ